MTVHSFTALLFVLTLLTSLHAQEAGRSESYIESNWGLANIIGKPIKVDNCDKWFYVDWGNETT